MTQNTKTPIKTPVKKPMIGAVPGFKPNFSGGSSGHNSANRPATSTNTKPDRRMNPNRVLRNQEIKANTITLIDQDGNMLGEMSRYDAVGKSMQAGLDMIQISYDPRANTAVCKLDDYGRYMYDKKKADSAKKQTQAKGMKEIKFGYNISENDFKMKINKSKEILSEGYTLKVEVKLKGRENIFKDKVREKLNKMIEDLSDVGRSQGIKELPKGFNVMFGPKKS